MKLRTLTVAVLAGVLFASSSIFPQHPSGDLPFSLAALELNLRVNYAGGTIGGSATMVLRNVSHHPAATVPLLLNRLMRVTSVTDTSGRPLRYTQDVVVFADDSVRQVSAIEVRAPGLVSPGRSIRIRVGYSGHLVGYAETGSLYIKDHVSREFTILREDAYAWPVLGVPSWAINRTRLDEPFDFAATVTVPESLVVAMGGELESRRPGNGSVTWAYHSTAPVPFLNIAIAPYRLLERGGARIFYFPADSTGASQVERAITGAMDRFAHWFGPLHKTARLTVMEIPEGWGSQASLTAGIIQTADAFQNRSQLRLLYHELSHLWNVADLDRPSPRWNEGLATFLQWRMAAELDGWDEWNSRIARAVQGLRQDCPAAGCDTIPLVKYGKAGLTDRSYSAGFLMFYILSQVIEPAAFDSAYRGFFQSHLDRGATSADLATAFIAVDPRSRPILDDWFVTTRWYAALAAGKAVPEMIEEYRVPPTH